MDERLTQQSRYRAAANFLDDPAGLARLAQRVAGVGASAEPRVATLAGARRLCAARRVGLFAGSFNPLTRAHVALVSAARRAADLDVVIWACAAA